MWPGLDVVVFAIVIAGIDVDEDAVKLPDRVEEIMPDRLRDRVALGQSPVTVNNGMKARLEPMADPANSDVRYRLHANGVRGDRRDLVDECRIDGIHEPPEDLNRCTFEDPPDGDGDDGSAHFLCRKVQTHRSWVLPS